jgi:hypothetical protein
LTEKCQPSPALDRAGLFVLDCSEFSDFRVGYRFRSLRFAGTAEAAVPTWILATTEVTIKVKQIQNQNRKQGENVSTLLE